MINMGPIWLIDVVLALASAVIIIWVASMYFKSSRVVRSGLSLALVILMVLIGVKNIFGVFIYLSLSRFYGADVGLHMMPISILDLAIVALLFWIVRR
jgi:hypothetical protein